VVQLAGPSEGLTAVSTLPLSAAPELNDKHLAEARRHAIDAVVFVRHEKHRVALLKRVRSHGTIRFERLKSSTLKVVCVGEHDVQSYQGVKVIVPWVGQGAVGT
jgi:hypothetical protein